MGSTLPADFVFEPKVWADHVEAYYPKKLVMGRFAMSDNTLEGQPGMTVNMPFFKQIGAAEEPGVADALTVDKLQDDSFSATIKEVAKAVGVRRSALRKSAAARERIFSEVQSQIARVHAEKIDTDLLAECYTSGNYVQGYLATAAANLMSIRTLLEAKITAFGDKHDQAIAAIMHSLQFKDLMSDSTAGFLKADANDPLWGMPGFEGRMVGLAIVTVDQVQQHANIDSKKAYDCLILKANPYGFLTAESPDMESDYDLLNREYIFAMTQYYAVKAFHAKVSADDKRIALCSTTTTVAA